MPHSLKAKIKGLRFKGIITDNDCDRLCKALDNENVLNKLQSDIVDRAFNGRCGEATKTGMLIAASMIDKYKTVKENEK